MIARQELFSLSRYANAPVHLQSRVHGSHGGAGRLFVEFLDIDRFAFGNKREKRRSYLHRLRGNLLPHAFADERAYFARGYSSHAGSVTPRMSARKILWLPTTDYLLLTTNCPVIDSLS